MSAPRCVVGRHVGPFRDRPDIYVWLKGSLEGVDLDAENIAAIPPQVDCLACGSTIGVDQIAESERRAA